MEVGYDDPDMALVYQHYAPNNLASFIQRKGRGGRGLDDRPVTGVTLSPYSPQDSWYFRRPQRMLDSAHFEVPLNADNYFVRRGQLLATLLDALARHEIVHGRTGLAIEDGRVTVNKQTRQSTEQLVRAIFGAEIYQQLEAADLDDLWRQAIDEATKPLDANVSLMDLRAVLAWIPRTLFSTANLPALAVRFESEGSGVLSQEEPINLAFEAATPGNMTRRYGFSLLHWLLPKVGRKPWLSDEVYRVSKGFTISPLQQGSDALLRELPVEAREEVGPEIHPNICRPGGVTLETAGRMRGTWTAYWYYDAQKRVVQRIGTTEPDSGLKVHHKSRGNLRGFLYVEAQPGVGHALSIRGLERFAERFEAYIGGRTKGSQTGLTLTSLTWGADVELRLMDPGQPDIPITQTFIHPNSGKTLLHGYRVQTEGVRLYLNSDYLTNFIHAEVERQREHPDGRWLRGQMFRYLIGSQARAAGINAYEANRVADLLFSAAGRTDLRAKLSGLVRRWDSQTLRELLQQTFTEILAYHPLLSERRVDRLADSLDDRKFQLVFKQALEAVRSNEQFAAYLRSVLIHSLAVRLKQNFVLHGLGDERQVLVHAKLPIQFGADAKDVITVAENGAHGDGTTRMFVENLERALQELSGEELTECPNAREDAIIERAFQKIDRHAEWRSLDPRNPEQMAGLAAELEFGPTIEEASMQSVLRLLYGTESVATERFDLYDLHGEITAIAARLQETMAREASQWELVSAVVRAASDGAPDTPRLSSLIRAYRGLEEASQEESFEAAARLADQVYRLSARLCVDGCQGCLHSGGDLMPAALAEAAVSRRLLERLTA